MGGWILLAFVLVSAGEAHAQSCTTSAAQIVDDVYKQVLERPADPGSALFTEALLSGRMSVRDVVAAVAKSPEHLERFFWQPLVTTVYREVLRRNPSPQEQRIAVRDLMQNPGSVDSFVAHTATRAANNEQEAVRILYQRLLGREPDPGGLQSAIALAQRQGIAAVAESIVNSEEYQRRTYGRGIREATITPYEHGVAALYQHLLERPPDPEGARDLTQLASVYGLDSVVDRIVSSREYVGRYGEQGVPGRADVQFCAPDAGIRRARPRFTTR